MQGRKDEEGLSEKKAHNEGLWMAVRKKLEYLGHAGIPIFTYASHVLINHDTQYSLF